MYDYETVRRAVVIRQEQVKFDNQKGSMNSNK